MIDRTICPRAKRRDASTAEKFRTRSWPRARAQSSYTRGGPRGHHERSLHAAATCTIRDVTIRSPVVGNQPFRVYPWPSICRGANVNPAAVERHVHCYYSARANKTIACARVGVAACHRLLLSTGTLVGMYEPNYYYRIYTWLYIWSVSRISGIVRELYVKSRLSYSFLRYAIFMRIHTYVG